MTFDPRTFITAGTAIFTLEGREARYTFKVSRRGGDDVTNPPIYFVSLLTGPDNTADYTYMGVLNADTGYVHLTRASTYTPESTPVKALRWALPILWRGDTLPPPARLMHIGKCGRCGRALTVPTSIDAGVGPECATKL